MMEWAYGVTTVASRRQTYLPATLLSLERAGFDSPRLFVDGDGDPVSWRREFDLDVTCRTPGVGTAGNWFLSLGELFVRQPHADRYAMFQDDLIACKGLREYLERSLYPSPGYLNLYSFRENDTLCLTCGKTGWVEASALKQSGTDILWQTGRGAVALVFDNAAASALLQSKHMVERPKDGPWGKVKVDDGIVTAMNKAGFREHVHCPSLVQHAGIESAMHLVGGKPKIARTFATTFRGEDWDATTLLEK